MAPKPATSFDIAELVCDAALKGETEQGTMVCGRGVGASIAANSTHLSVEHGGVNKLCIGARIVGNKLVFDLLRAFLKAEHSLDEEYRRRVAKLMELEGC